MSLERNKRKKGKLTRRRVSQRKRVSQRRSNRKGSRRSKRRHTMRGGANTQSIIEHAEKGAGMDAPSILKVLHARDKEEYGSKGTGMKEWVSGLGHRNPANIAFLNLLEKVEGKGAVDKFQKEVKDVETEQKKKDDKKDMEATKKILMNELIPEYDKMITNHVERNVKVKKGPVPVFGPAARSMARHRPSYQEERKMLIRKRDATKHKIIDSDWKTWWKNKGKEGVSNTMSERSKSWKEWQERSIRSRPPRVRRRPSQRPVSRLDSLMKKITL